MIYHSDKALFVKIAERLCDDILADRYREGDRVPSVRELAADHVPGFLSGGRWPVGQSGRF